MSYNKGRIPLHMQNTEIAKAVKKNPSYESFRENEIHKPQYSSMEDRPSTVEMSRMRRYPNGQLDMGWAARAVCNSIHAAERGENLTPLEESLLTVLFPIKFRKVEPAQAEIRTQLSKTEKKYLRELVEAWLKEELNWNSGLGGGSVPGRSRTLTE